MLFVATHMSLTTIIVVVVATALIAFQEWHDSSRQEAVKKQHRLQSELAASALKESEQSVSSLTAINRQLASDLTDQEVALAVTNEELERKDARVAELEAELAELKALFKPKPRVRRPRSPFELACTEKGMINKLLPEALRYCEESFAYRLAEASPENSDVHVINGIDGDFVTCIVARQEGSVIADGRRWFTAVDGERNHLISLKDEAKLFAVKLHIATGHLEQLNVGECAHLAGDFLHLLATGGSSMLRIVANMSQSIKMDALDRKADRILLLLDSAQIGRVNAIFVGAGEHYRGDSIDQNRIASLRQELMQLEWELLSELRALLATAPDVRAFQLKWGLLQRSSREEFYNRHFRGGIGKIHLVIEAFLIDMILAQDSGSRDHFFAYTVEQQARELAKINEILKAQLGEIKDLDLVQEAQALYKLCDQFQVLLDHLVLPPRHANVAA